MLDSAGKLNRHRVMVAELMVAASADPRQLTGCGMLVVNPPTNLRVHLQDSLEWLWTHLAIDSNTGVNVSWISAQHPTC